MQTAHVEGIPFASTSPKLKHSPVWLHRFRWLVSSEHHTIEEYIICLVGDSFLGLCCGNSNGVPHSTCHHPNRIVGTLSVAPAASLILPFTVFMKGGGIWIASPTHRGEDVGATLRPSSKPQPPSGTASGQGLQPPAVAAPTLASGQLATHENCCWKLNWAITTVKEASPPIVVRTEGEKDYPSGRRKS